MGLLKSFLLAISACVLDRVLGNFFPEVSCLLQALLKVQDESVVQIS